MFDCTTDKYDALYARWLKEPGKLLELGELKEGDRVIDLCGGTGLVAYEAICRGARCAFVVDLKPRIAHLPDDMRMIPPFWGKAEEVDILLERHIDTLHDLAEKYSDGKTTGCPPGCRCKRYRLGTFDLVVCRQAINYLDLHKVASAVHKVLRPGGRFVFNTFGKPRFFAKSYRHDGRRFFELAGHLGDHVVHLQAGLGIGVDVSKFRWYRHDQIKDAMTPYFLVKDFVQKNSIYYLCRKASHIRPLL